MNNPLNKLNALNVLAHAYMHVFAVRSSCLATAIIEEKFHQVRRSIQDIEEVLPIPAFNEGLNGKMPTHF